MNYLHIGAAMKQAGTMTGERDRIVASLTGDDDSPTAASDRCIELAIKMMRCEGFCAESQTTLTDGRYLDHLICELPMGHSGPHEWGLPEEEAA